MINWHDIDTVLLDMDGTLLDLHFDNYFWLEHLPRRYASIHGKDETSCRQILADHFESKRGTLNWYCLDYWAEQLQLDVPALKREIQHMITIRPFVMDFLTQLQQSPKNVMLVTNAHRASLDIKLNRTGIASLFDEIVVSHDYRAPKEDQQFWQQMRINHRFDPARTLLIDDTSSVLFSAKQFGIKHLLTLLQPDSKQAERQETEFPGILHFDEIMPIQKFPEIEKGQYV
ncbi:MAG: HAD superfamily hydrolase (TIGR01509 family) [Oceanicoccus sp.]|jgi:HAD superfamily hydrolase (TIGR01509 family)